jgi:hypothetical protein
MMSTIKLVMGNRLMGTSNNYQFVTPAQAGVQYC